MIGANITGILAVLGSILSVVSVLYGIAQALQKADAKYVATLQSRVLEDSFRITALENSLKLATLDREKLTTDLLRVTDLLMDAQLQLATTTHSIRKDIAETTSVAKEAVSEANKAYHEANSVNNKIADLHEQLNESIRHNIEALERSEARDSGEHT